MEDKFQDQGHIDKYLEEWLSPRRIKTNRGLFYEEEKEDYTCIKDSSPEVAIINNQAPEGSISPKIVVIVKC